MMLRRWAARCALGWFVWVPLAGCGSSSTSSDPKAPRAQKSEAPESSDDQSSADDQDESEPPSAATRHRPSCDDGSCFACGSGLCPIGFYCDEGAESGPACSWLPDCATKASCKCVTRQLGGSCSCEERSGGIHVKC